MIQQDPHLEEALQQSRRVGDLLLKNEEQETAEISRLAADLLDREYRYPLLPFLYSCTEEDELLRISRTSNLTDLHKLPVAMGMQMAIVLYPTAGLLSLPQFTAVQALYFVMFCGEDAWPCRAPLKEPPCLKEREACIQCYKENVQVSDYA